MTAARYIPQRMSQRAQFSLDQGMFDFLVPYKKPTLKPKEAAKCLGDKSVDFVLDLIQTGQLESIPMSAKGERPIYVVTRRSVLVLLASKAMFDPQDFQICIRSMLESFDVAALDFTLKAATEVRAKAAMKS